MRESTLSVNDLRGVFAVPPLARRTDARRAIDFNESEKIVRHILAGGVTRLMYGGNAFLYHLALAEYAELVEWLASQPGDCTLIPSAGPSFGRLMDQAPLLRRHGFPCVMVLPCHDPRDAEGLERGLREFRDAAAMPLVVYVKDEQGFGPDLNAGLDSISRLVESGVCCAIKYAVVRKDPAEDEYLAGLLGRVDANRVISGIGERPAIVHMLKWGLPGFTTGSGSVAPALSQALFEACAHKEADQGEALRAPFLPLEDLRDAWGPPRVLHAAVAAAGIAETGPVPPFLTALSSRQLEALRPVARALIAHQGKAARNRP